MVLPEEIMSLLHSNLDLRQVSGEATEVISKVYRNEELSAHDLDILLNPTEAAALLSAKYKRAISHRYIKEITRAVKNPSTGHITPARLTHDRIAGKTHLYRAENILNVRLRQKPNSNIDQSEATLEAA